MQFDLSVGHLELVSQLETFRAAIAHGSGFLVVQFLILPSTCEVSEIKRIQKPPKRAEFLEFVTKRQSANHSLKFSLLPLPLKP